jgi:hypothetical protein
MYATPMNPPAITISRGGHAVAVHLLATHGLIPPVLCRISYRTPGHLTARCMRVYPKPPVVA